MIKNIFYAFLLSVLSLNLISCGSHKSVNKGFTQNSASNSGLKADTLEGEIKTAMDTGDYALFLSLMSKNVDVNSRIPGSQGATLLIYASLKNLPKFSYHLIQLGADAALTDDKGETAFSVAESVGNRDRILMLLDPERQKAAQQELMTAVARKKIQTIESLLKAGADPNFYDEQSGETPLTLAVTVKKAANVVKFVAEWKDPELGISATDINFANREGYTPLGYAIFLQNNDVINVLKSLNAKETL